MKLLDVDREVRRHLEENGRVSFDSGAACLPLLEVTQ